MTNLVPLVKKLDLGGFITNCENKAREWEENISLSIDI